MNSIKTNFPGSADDLDCLLRRFFQAEMPQPWPGLQSPASESSSGRPLLWQRYRSKLALAASVALLLLGSWWLAGRSADYSVPVVQFPPGMGNAEKPKVPSIPDKP